MKKIFTLLFFFLPCLIQAQKSESEMVENHEESLSLNTDNSVLEPRAYNLLEINDSIINHEKKPKHYLAAVAEVTGINVFVQCFDRFILDADFAQISFHSVKHNFEYGFVWDNDQFSTNLFFHPYHGGLYFNAARTNGLNFWQSAPFSLGGSLMWEFCGEIEPPAINDVFATTFGGIAIGEITYRLSDLILDESAVGWNRFWRELLATAVCPVKGLNRLISGESFRHRTTLYKYHDYEALPVNFSVSVGTRYLADNGSIVRGEFAPFVAANVVYGDLYNTANNKPYDFFTAKVNADVSSNQPLISDVHFIGRLWGVDVNTVDTRMKSQFGFFQHFNYHNSEPVIDGKTQVPYRISEAASVGAGFIYTIPNLGHLNMFSQQLYLNLVMLGGGVSDYFTNIDRDYNMGSGYAVHLKSLLAFSKYGRFLLNVDYYNIRTWKGIEDKDVANIDPLYLNVQGNKSTANMFVTNMTMELNILPHLDYQLSVYFYYRNTDYDRDGYIYKYDINDNPLRIKDVTTHTFEVRTGLKYTI